jgi:hypothetical protein
VALPGHAPAPERKYCKFCRGSNRRELAAATCNYIDGIGHRCGAGICGRHTIALGPDEVRCPLHDPDHDTLYVEEAA